MTGSQKVTGLCPCGSGRRYAACCGSIHAGTRPARSAEALMRSRYSAYVLGLESYLLTTWHPETRPERLDLQTDHTVWLGLKILRTAQGGPGDERGEVGFVASYRVGREIHRLQEDSRFVRLRRNWVYLDGEGRR